MALESKLAGLLGILKEIEQKGMSAADYVAEMEKQVKELKTKIGQVREAAGLPKRKRKSVSGTVPDAGAEAAAESLKA